MSRLGMQTWAWTLCVLLSGMCMSQAAPGPHYMVPIPAVLEAGAETMVCASLMEPNETLTLTATLVSAEENITLFTHTSDKDFHVCKQFQVPFKKDEIQNFTVEVRGDTFYSEEVRKVEIKYYHPLTFVQTDKPIYLPGQTVNFRVVTLDTKLRAANGTYNIIAIQDPHGIKIAEWLNETSDNSILQHSFSLASDAQRGEYQIIVETVDEKTDHQFKVDKYVLPEFGVTLKVPEEISVKQKELESEVCAKYTFGQSVPGLVKLRACRNPKLHSNNVDLPEELLTTASCYSETKKTEKNGCATFTFSMSVFDPENLSFLKVTAKVVEEGTGIELTQIKEVGISYAVGELSIIDMPSIYHKGADLEGKAKAVDYNGEPIPDLQLYLYVFEFELSDPPTIQRNLTTDSEGLATFSISTDYFNRDINLHVSNNSVLKSTEPWVPYYTSDIYLVKKFKEDDEDTKTVSFLKVQEREDDLICDKEEEIQVNYTIVGEPQGVVDLMFLVLARGAIVSQGFQQFEVQATELNKGAVPFKVVVSPDMAPEIQVVAYAVLPGYSVIVDSAKFSTEQCFASKVSLAFTPTTGVPGGEANLQVTAQPGSLCGVSVVDQSVLIKEPGNTLEPATIFNLLPVISPIPIPGPVIDHPGCLPVRQKRNVIPHAHDSQEDPYSVFAGVGLKMATNLLIRIPSCLKFIEELYYRGTWSDAPVPKAETPKTVSLEASPPAASCNRAVTKTVRTVFPETWIWDLVEVGDSGRKDVVVKVPDTITTWETETFCLSPLGFGLAPRQNFTVFQPFFLELAVPYSVVQGEEFEVKATIFSYQPDCMMITVKLIEPVDDDFTRMESFCLCENERKTLNTNFNSTTLGEFKVTVAAEAEPSILQCSGTVVVPEQGRLDVVTKSTIVKAKGTETTDTYNWILCPDGGGVTEQVSISLPANVIDGSARASVSVLGSLVGRTLENLDKLLSLPVGSGEQNLAQLSTNVYILHYLSNTNQLTPDIRERFTNHLSRGLQTQLNYRSKDGAYSTFRSGVENSWLTALALKFFTKSRLYIDVDPALIDESKNWLKTRQRGNGCFKMSDKLFNNRMKGGVSDDVILTAYVTAALLDSGDQADNPVVKKSLGCLKESLNDLSNTYSTALLAYVFALAGDTETSDNLLQHLDTVAIRDGGFLHWSQKSAETSAPLSVEISSYVLLAKLSSCPTVDDQEYGFLIVNWLMRQQNSDGRFYSSQDTVVALQALALFSTLVFSPDNSSTVTLQAPSGPLIFEVNPDNKLFSQESLLQEVTGKFGLEVKGSACVSAQVAVDYNIPTPPQTTALSVKVEMEAEVNNSTRSKLTLKLQLLYSGQESETNLVIVDITMLSGFVPNEESADRLRGHHLVEHVETRSNHLVIYLEALSKNTPVNLNLDLIQVFPVKNLMSAVIKIYDYYEPSDRVQIEYSF